MTTIKNLLFDFGGIFMRITRDDAVRAFEQLGIHDANKLLDPYLQTGLFLELEKGQISPQEFLNRINKKYQLNLTHQDVEQALYQFIWDCEDYKFDFIEEEIPSNIRVMLLSNTNGFIFPWVNSGKYLKNGRAVSSYFNKVYLSFELGVCKPDPLIFEKVIADAHILPSETLFVDDAKANIDVAAQLGFQTYLAKSGEDWRQSIRQRLGLTQ